MQSPLSGDRQADAVDRRPVMVAALLDQMVALTSDRTLWALVGRYAQCADSPLDPDDWFPISAEAATARREAAAAIDLCESCLVRSQCLELSLRHWDIGQHGVWGGMVSADRAQLRTRLPAARGPHWSFGGAGGTPLSGAAS